VASGIWAWRENWGAFYVAATGLYYLGPAPDQRGALIRFISQAGGESKTLAGIPRTPAAGLSFLRMDTTCSIRNMTNQPPNCCWWKIPLTGCT